MRPDGAQKLPISLGFQFCSLEQGFLRPTSMLSQLLEKQRRLIAINDRALRVWPRLQARIRVPCSKAVPPPGTSPGRGAKPCMPQSVKVVGGVFFRFCFLNQNPEFNQTLRFFVFPWIFPPGCPPPFCFSQLH